jgi:hypothetical protein
MQYYRRGSLARAMRTLWYQDLTDVQRLRYGVQVSWGAGSAVGNSSSCHDCCYCSGAHPCKVVDCQ